MLVSTKVIRGKKSFNFIICFRRSCRFSLRASCFLELTARRKLNHFSSRICVWKESKSCKNIAIFRVYIHFWACLPLLEFHYETRKNWEVTMNRIFHVQLIKQFFIDIKCWSFHFKWSLFHIDHDEIIFITITIERNLAHESELIINSLK